MPRKIMQTVIPPGKTPWQETKRTFFHDNPQNKDTSVGGKGARFAWRALSPFGSDLMPTPMKPRTMSTRSRGLPAMVSPTAAVKTSIMVDSISRSLYVSSPTVWVMTLVVVTGVYSPKMDVTRALRPSRTAGEASFGRKSVT